MAKKIEYVSEDELEPEYVSEDALESDSVEQPTEGNVLTKLIQNNRQAGVQGALSAIPTSKEEALDVLRVGGRQLLPGARDENINLFTQGAFGAGLNLAGITEAEGFIQEPKTGFGQTLENSADAAQLLSGLVSAKSSIGKLFKKNMPASKIEDMISKLESNESFMGNLIKKSKDLAIDKVAGEYDAKTLQAKERLRALTGDAVLLRQTTQDEMARINSSIGQLDGVSSDASRDLVIRGREVFPKVAAKISNDFGNEIRKASGDVEIPYSDLKESINNSMKNGYLKSLFDKLTFAPEGLSPEDKKVLSFVDRVRSDEGVDRVRLLDLDKEISGIIGKTGKQYSSAQRSLTELRRIYLDAVGDSNKELLLVKTKFKPKLQFKDKFFDVFEPFNPQGPLDTAKGTSYFKKIVDGNFSKDDVDFMGLFEREIGPDLLDPIKNLAKEKSDMVSKVNKTKEFYTNKSREILSEKFSINDFIRSNDAQKLKAVEEVQKPFDLEVIKKTASKNKSKKELGNLLDKAEKSDLGKKLVRMVVKEGLTQAKRSVKGF